MSLKDKGLFRFDRFKLDVDERLLERNGKRLDLPERAFDVLCVLVKNSGRLVTKDQLLSDVWKGAFVEENSINKNISLLRRLLGSGRINEKFIETVRGHGFRFVAKVSTEPPEQAAVKSGQGAVLRMEPHRLPQGYRERSNVVALRDWHKDGPENGSLDASEKVQPLKPFEENRSRGGTWRIAGAVLMGLVAVLSGVLLYRQSAGPSTQAGKIRTLAVLPFKPLVSDKGDESLQMGVSETLISRLGSTGQIIVRPLNAVRRYSDLHQDPLVAGRELGVEAVLDGHIQESDGRIRLTVRMIKVADGEQLWSGQFDEPAADIFVLQNAITARIANSLSIEITGEEQRRFTKNYTDNVEAYQAYIHGRYYRNKRTETGSLTAIRYFEDAIAKDPNYALAYAGLAEGLIGLSVFGSMPPAELFPKAEAAALTALKLDDTIAESHVALAHFKNQFDRDWTGAERAYQRALELNPGYADARRLYAILLMEGGRNDEGFAQMNRALEIDPTSVIYNATLGVFYYWSRQNDRAHAQLKKTIDMEPAHWMAHYWLAHVLVATGDHERALTEARQARELSGDVGTIWLIGYVSAAAGRPAKAKEVIDELLALSMDRYIPAHDLAQIYAGFGDKDQVIRWLNKADAERSRGMDFLKVNPVFDSVRSDPRFQEIIKRMGREP